MTAEQASRRRLLYAALSALVLGLDLWTKELAETRLPLHGGSVKLIDGFLSLALVHNTGAAFGLFSSADPVTTSRALNVVALIALSIVGVYAWRSPVDRSRLQAGLALIFGGALGNFLDRFSLGYVVDFIEVYWRSFHWPNFNVADSAISIGVGLLILDSFFVEPDPAARESES